MTTIIDCPSCNRPLRLPDDLLGRLVKCPSCGSDFTAAAPMPEEAAAPPRARKGPAPSADDEEEPRGRPRRHSEYEDADDDDNRPVRRRADTKPGKVQAVGIMMLIGGILALIHGVGWMIAGVATMGLCCLWPGTYYSLVLGIMATMKGSSLLGERADQQATPKGIAIMQIINIINLDIPNCVMGIISLVFLNEPETRDYFRG